MLKLSVEQILKPRNDVITVPQQLIGDYIYDADF